MSILLWLAACSSSAPTSTSSVRFTLDETPLPFGAVPFPSDRYRDDEGRIRIGALPNPESDQPLLVAVRELLAERGGFCTTCNLTFTIDGGLDPTSVPPSAEPGEEASLADSVLLLDVDPASPERGRRIPLRVQWDPAVGTLTVRPVRGITLHRSRRYAAVATSDLRGADGLPLSPSAAFAALRDTDPAVAELAALGVDPERIAGLAAFTTDDPTTDLQHLRSAIRRASPPVATVDGVWAGAELDALLGIPGEDRPGADVPPLAGTEGTAAVPHATTRFAISGTFGAPRFVSGVGSDIGEVTRDADGAPVSTLDEPVPFLLIVPADADLANLPVVVAHHGFNASRTTGFTLADTAGQAGFAVLSLDAFQHGARAASARDEVHAMRGIDGPDGFAETTELEVSGRLFGLIGAPPEMAVYPGYPLGGFEQFAADVFSAVRLVEEGDLAAIQAADPSLGALGFDRDRIVFFGNSMGAVVGTLVVAAEPDIRAAILDVLPGSIVDTLVESTEFRPLAEDLLLPTMGVDTRYDEIDRSLTYDPLVDLIRWVLEPVDPQALAPYLQGERLAGDPPPDLLVQLAGHDEVAAPAASESVVAAAGLDGMGTFGFAVVDPLALPAAGAGVERFEGAMHGMFEVAEQLSSWDEPLVPPLSPRSPTVVENPIEAVHDQIQVFLQTFREDGHGAIVP